MCSYNLLFFPCQNQFDKTCRFIRRLGAVDLRPWELGCAHMLILLFCLDGRESDSGNFWLSKGTPWYNTVIYFLLCQWYQSITHGYSGLIGGNMCKKVASYHITESKIVRG